jgi:hypothetical protein
MLLLLLLADQSIPPSSFCSLKQTTFIPQLATDVVNSAASSDPPVDVSHYCLAVLTHSGLALQAPINLLKIYAEELALLGDGPGGEQQVVSRDVISSQILALFAGMNIDSHGVLQHYCTPYYLPSAACC